MRRFIIVAVLATACSSTTTASTTVPPAPPTPVAPSRATSEPPPTQVAPSSVVPTVSTAPTTTSPITEARRGWYAASITGLLTEDFIDGLTDLDGVTNVSVVWVGNAPVTQIRAAGGAVIARAAEGLVFPIDRSPRHKPGQPCRVRAAGRDCGVAVVAGQRDRPRSSIRRLPGSRRRSNVQPR